MYTLYEFNIGLRTWRHEYKTFSAAKAAMTRTLKHWVNVYGSYPKMYGIKTVKE